MCSQGPCRKTEQESGHPLPLVQLLSLDRGLWNHAFRLFGLRKGQRRQTNDYCVRGYHVATAGLGCDRLGPFHPPWTQSVLQVLVLRW